MLQRELIPNQNLLEREELSTSTAITIRGTKNHEGESASTYARRRWFK
jgi:hypothetical protein